VCITKITMWCYCKQKEKRRMGERLGKAKEPKLYLINIHSFLEPY
jgi:hypothetical protein